MSVLALMKLCGLVAVYGLASLLVWIFIFDGIAARIVYSPKPTIIRYQSTRDVAFVYFTGTQSSGVDHSAQMRDLWSQHGDDIVVQYNPKRFDAATIVKTTHEQLLAWGYRKVILDGASLGFMLVTDLIDYDRLHGNQFKFAVIEQDGVTSTNDLVQGTQARAVARIWHAGPVANFLLTRVFWGAAFNPPPRNTLGAGVDDELLRKHHEASKTYPLSGWTDELRYIAGHPGYRAGQYAGIPIVIMRSHPVGVTGSDGVVRSSAADKIQAIFRGGTIIEVNGSTHMAFMEFPDLWRNKFRLAFRALPGW